MTHEPGELSLCMKIQVKLIQIAPAILEGFQKLRQVTATPPGGVSRH